MTTPLLAPVPTSTRLVQRLQAVPRAHLWALAVVLLSLAVPGSGTALRGQVRLGVAITAGFVVSALLPVTALAVIGMACFWVWGVASALPVPGED